MTGIAFVGGPTALIEVGGVRLLTDPTFSPAGTHESAPGRPLTKTEPPALTVAEVSPVDAVLLSHDQHADNLDPGGREFLGSVPLTLTTPEGAARLGGGAHGMQPWETISVGDVEVTAVPARHGPPGCEPITGAVTGFVLSGRDVLPVYVSGDNAALELVEEIRERIGTIDVALLFAGAARTSLFDGAPLTLTSADAARAAAILDARYVIPLHVRGWTHFTEGPEALAMAFDDAGQAHRLVLLAPGERWQRPAEEGR